MERLSTRLSSNRPRCTVFGGIYSTLAATDVCTGWTICILVKDKTQFQMLKALIKLKIIMPFPLLGIHSDNGAEFINQTILSFAETKQIKFTRSRPYKKNDNPHIEQKIIASFEEIPVIYESRINHKRK